MLTITLYCAYCGSDARVRDGHAPNGKQKYRCHACRRRGRENPTPNAYAETRREEILHTYQERSSLRGLTRTFGISRTTVSSWIKKVAQLPPLHTALLTPDPTDSATTILELDELWSYVLKKAHASWIGIALCRKTRQVVGFAIGDRNRQDVSTLVGGYSRQLSCRSLFPRFLGNVSGSDPRSTTHSRRKRNWGNSSCGAMEEHPATTPRSFCPHDLIFFKVGGNA